MTEHGRLRALRAHGSRRLADRRRSRWSGFVLQGAGHLLEARSRQSGRHPETSESPLM